jgi:hypothetical protein
MIIIAGLILAFVLMMLFGNRTTRQCKWRMDRAREQDGQSFYRCAACGEIRFTNDGRPPKLCATEVPPPSM